MSGVSAMVKTPRLSANRGDRLHLTFSTDDTGHSFYLEEFDIDAKISPARDQVEVFKTSDPTQESVTTHELTFTARQPGILNYLVSRSNYRCHVWCGPMHAFEMGKLVIMPNTLLVFSLGCILIAVRFIVYNMLLNSYLRYTFLFLPHFFGKRGLIL